MEIGEEELGKKTKPQPFFFYSEPSDLCDHLQGRRHNHKLTLYKARDWTWFHTSILQ